MANALADHRDRFNSVVSQATRTYVDFDTWTLEQQLRGPLRELVDACDRVASGSGARVLAAIFEPVVELVGQHRLGGGSHDPLLAVLPDLARLLIDDPRRVFGSLANAVVHLHGFGASVEEWIGRVKSAAPTDAQATLSTGQVAAWALGLSHFRESALDVASRLPDDALAVALGEAHAPLPSEAVKQLREDRWWRPGRARPESTTVAHRVGSFRGFGGPFLQAPRAGTRDDHVVVCAGDEAWALHADAWGATLTRTHADDVQFGVSPLAAVPPGLVPTSAAATSDISAVTTATSYQVLVVEPHRWRP